MTITPSEKKDIDRYLTGTKGHKSCLFYIAVALIMTLVAVRAGAQYGGAINLNKKAPKTTLLPIGDASYMVVDSAILVPRDTIYTHDTIRIPVPLYQSYDTMQVVLMMRSGKMIPAHIIYQGFKQQTPKGLQWVQEPQPGAVLTTRWKVIDKKNIFKVL